MADGQKATQGPASFDTDPVVHALCGERVVLLGESPTHSFGGTVEFKAQLVHRLVDECHFNALFIESRVLDAMEASLRAAALKRTLE